MEKDKQNLQEACYKYLENYISNPAGNQSKDQRSLVIRQINMLEYNKQKKRGLSMICIYDLTPLRCGEKPPPPHRRG